MNEAPFNHIGILVDDLESAILRFSDAFGVTFHAPASVSVQLSDGTPAESAQLRFTYSREGPPYIELLQRTGNGVFGGDAREGFHHVGGWHADPAARARHLRNVGIATEADVLDDAGEAQTVFTKPSDLHGVRLELLHESLRPATEHWIATGEFTYPSSM